MVNSEPWDRDYLQPWQIGHEQRKKSASLLQPRVKCDPRISSKVTKMAWSRTLGWTPGKKKMTMELIACRWGFTQEWVIILWFTDSPLQGLFEFWVLMLPSPIAPTVQCWCLSWWFYVCTFHFRLAVPSFLNSWASFLKSNEFLYAQGINRKSKRI